MKAKKLFNTLQTIKDSPSGNFDSMNVTSLLKNNDDGTVTRFEVDYIHVRGNEIILECHKD